jgi:hypothetical protein
MSVEIGYFFNSDKNLLELKEDINNCLGCSLAPCEADSENLLDWFLGMEFSLCEVNHLENDGELNFEDFKYELNFRIAWGNAQMRPILLPAILTVIYALHKWHGITGMLVYEVQILLARYEERDDENLGRCLFDSVSKSLFVDFSEHLRVISNRRQAEL